MASLAIAALLAAGCGSDQKNAPPATGNPFEPRAAQPRLPTIKLFIDNQTLTAEVAHQPLQIMTGMMFRTNLPPDEGMLFVFGDADRRSFWMKNCVVPLSAAYVDPEGVIREIHDLVPGETNSVVSDSRFIQYVIEVNRDWFRTNGLRPGATVRTERGSLRDTFFRFEPPPR